MESRRLEVECSAFEGKSQSRSWGAVGSGHQKPEHLVEKNAPGVLLKRSPTCSEFQI